MMDEELKEIIEKNLIDIRKIEEKDDIIYLIRIDVDYEQLEEITQRLKTHNLCGYITNSKLKDIKKLPILNKKGDK